MVTCADVSLPAGVVELYQLMAKEGAEKHTNCPTSDIEQITGRKPMTVNEWVMQNREAFSTTGAA